MKSVRKGVLRLLGASRVSRGKDDDGGWDDPLAEESPALAAVSAASIQQMSALGDRAGKSTRRLGETPDDVGAQPKRKRHARFQGFDLHAGAPTKAEERDRLERMLRYLLRPPIAARLRATRFGAAFDFRVQDLAVALAKADSCSSPPSRCALRRGFRFPRSKIAP